MEKMNAFREKWEPAIILAGLAAFFLACLGPGVVHLLPITWHYILSALLLILCWRAKENGMKRVCFVCCALLYIVAVVGFITVYLGPFVESGKSFYSYVTFYAPFTLPVFLFPVAGMLLSLRKG